MYKILDKQTFSEGEYSLVPIRIEDRYEIMKWRNEQMYHLRQNEPLTKEKQDYYFDSVISRLFEQDRPPQILFSYLEGEKCIGYGGLVHVNWIDKNAELSFIIDTQLEKEYFKFHWSTFLFLIQEIGFGKLNFHKLFTYAFDIRPKLYSILEEASFMLEAELKEHCFFEGNFINVKIHSKLNSLNDFKLRSANSSDSQITFEWANNMDIRKFSFNNDSLLWDDHIRWFNEKINSSNCAYYILELEEQSVGSIRFDLENSSAKINYLVDPKFTGKGLGTKILKEGITKLRSDKPLINLVYGFVFKNNLPSIKIFEKLGFQKVLENGNDFKYEKRI